MFDEADDNTVVYRVVVNHEEQYSIWPADRDLPAGWRDEGTVGPKPDCLAHIDEVWTDMRPLSLRRFMQEAAAAEPAVADEEPDDEEPLIDRLSRGEHAVEVTVRPERTGPALRESIERGYVFVRFMGTRGGTELGVKLDPTACDVSSGDFDTPSGRIRLVGDLTLDFEQVRCTAEIDLDTMAGLGHLAVRVQAA
jgi:uncharacterized protein YbdZ (MbtH family)